MSLFRFSAKMKNGSSIVATLGHDYSSIYNYATYMAEEVKLQNKVRKDQYQELVKIVSVDLAMKNNWTNKEATYFAVTVLDILLLH